MSARLSDRVGRGVLRLAALLALVPVHAGAAPDFDAARLRAEADLAAQRRAGFQLFQAWVDGARRPAFAAGYTDAETFAAEDVRRPRLPFPGLPLGGGDAPAARARHGANAPVITFVHYDAAARAHIRGEALHRVERLEALRTAGPADVLAPGLRTIPPFPREASVVMTGWWPVAARGLTPLPVWDADAPGVRVDGGNGYTNWSRVVRVAPRAGAPEARTRSVEFAGRRHVDATIVPLARFHHLRVDAGLALRLNEDPGAAKAALIALGRPLAAGDSLALVALHGVSFASEDGVWVTAWWHDRPRAGPFASDRPRSLRAPWSNYLLDVAFDATLPRAADGGPRSVFNPWFEGPFPDGGAGNGLRSNCVNCHARASYPRTAFLPVRRGPPDVANDPAFTPGRLRTGRIWAIAPRPREPARSAEQRREPP